MPFAGGFAFPSVADVGGACLLSRLQPVLDEGIVSAFEIGSLGGDIHRDHVRPFVALGGPNPVSVEGVIIDRPAAGNERVPNIGVPAQFEVP